MKTTAILVGLAVMLGTGVPVFAEPPDIVQAGPDMLVAYDGMGSGGNRPMMQAPGRPGGWQRGAGQHQRRRRPPFIAIVLMNRQALGLSTQQVDSLRKLGMDSRRAAIQRKADLQIGMLDLMNLRWSDPVDMGKIETKVREIEKLKGDGLVAKIRTGEAVKAQLTAEQREKLKNLWGTRGGMRGGPRRGSGEGGSEDSAASEDDS